jgi:hypothetical protein
MSYKASITLFPIRLIICRNNGADDWGEKRQQRSKFGSEEESRGREGGRSVRSIATNKDSDTRGKSGGGGSSDMDDWGAMSSSSSGISTKSPEPSSFDNSFNIASWGDSLSAATGGAKKKISEERIPAQAAETDEGFER